MLPEFDRDSRFTRGEILGFTVLLIVITMLPVVSRAGIVYFVTMAVSGSYLLYHASQLLRSSARMTASRLLHASVLYLPVVLAMMIAYKR